jgi:hypothetical protein
MRLVCAAQCRMARRFASLIEFQHRLPDEANCALSCSGGAGRTGSPAVHAGTRSWPLDSRAYTRECRTCGRQTAVAAGTIMQRTRLPLTRLFRDDVVLGGPLDGEPRQRHLGAAVDGATGPRLRQGRLAARAAAAAIHGRSRPRSAGHDPLATIRWRAWSRWTRPRCRREPTTIRTPRSRPARSSSSVPSR